MTSDLVVKTDRSRQDVFVFRVQGREGAPLDSGIGVIHGIDPQRPVSLHLIFNLDDNRALIAYKSTPNLRLQKPFFLTVIEPRIRIRWKKYQNLSRKGSSLIPLHLNSFVCCLYRRSEKMIIFS